MNTMTLNVPHCRFTEYEVSDLEWMIPLGMVSEAEDLPFGKKPEEESAAAGVLLTSLSKALGFGELSMSFDTQGYPCSSNWIFRWSVTVCGKKFGNIFIVPGYQVMQMRPVEVIDMAQHLKDELSRAHQSTRRKP